MKKTNIIKMMRSFLCIMLCVATLSGVTVFAAEDNNPDKAQQAQIGNFAGYGYADLIIDAAARLDAKEMKTLITDALLEVAVFEAACADYLSGISSLKSSDGLLGEYISDRLYEKYGDEIIHITPTLIYDCTTHVIGREDGRGFLFLGYDYDVKNGVWMGSINAWQKNFGYGWLYDLLAPIGWMFFDTFRVYFTYGDKDYLVQVWKGKYGITSGGEVGAYSRESGPGNVYMGIDNDNLPLMSMQVKTKSGRMLLDMEERPHWWLTGFKLFAPYFASNLTLTATVDFVDKGISKAFIEALPTAKTLYRFNYSVDGTKVTFEW